MRSIRWNNMVICDVCEYFYGNPLHHSWYSKEGRYMLMRLHNSILGTLDIDEELVIIQYSGADDIDDNDDFELYLTSYEDYDEGRVI